MTHKKFLPLLLVTMGHTAGAQTPVTIFGNAVPHNPVISEDRAAVTLGVKFRSTQSGTLNGIRFYRGASNGNGYTAKLFTVGGSLLASSRVRQETCTVPCWEQVNFASPISLAANTTYVAAYYTSNGRYADDEMTSGGLTNAVISGPLTALASSPSGGNGVYTYSTGFPNQTWHNSNYYVDVVFTPTQQIPYLIMSFDPSAPSIPSSAPINTLVSAVNTSWSDNSPFTGTDGFVAPSFDDSGTFALSGTNLVVNSNLAADGGTTQNVTIQSAQGTASVTKTLSIQVVSGQTPTGVSFSPSGSVNVIDTSTAGTPISSVQVSTSDGVQFAGTVSISSQSIAGMTSLSSATVPSNVQVASVNSGDDGPQTVTVQAVENGVTKSATLAMNVIPLSTSTILPLDRDASANWRMAGMLSVGGIPNRTTVCATVNPRGGGADDTSNIQSAINSCPSGQVVSLAAGTFTINEGSIVHLSSAVTLRGAGPTATHLVRTNGAQLGSYFPGSNQSELIRISGNGASGSTVALIADAAQGDTSVQVSNAAGYSVGEIVLIDEVSGSGWQPDRSGQGQQIWASPDYRVAWNIHNPSAGGDDCCVGQSGTIFDYFQNHTDHPTNEMKRISAISGNTITFDSPIMISYRMSHGAQMTPMLTGPTNAGVEELSVQGGDNGNIRFEGVAYAWAKNIDSSLWLNEGFAIDNSFRVQLEGIYSHKAVWPVPGGGGYAISFAFGSSEALIENSISVLANKVMVARASGAGSVVAYNYMDDGFIYNQDGWQEIGLNASHLVGPHHVLFEGNQSFNIDSDQTHGNSIYMTFLRNYTTGYRARFTDYLNNTVIDDANNLPGGNGLLRAAGAHAFAYWHSFVGNVLGLPGHTSGLVYDGIGGHNAFPPDGIWALGWVDISPQGYDPNVATTAIRHGNYDYLTNSVHWNPNISNQSLPNSLYLTQAPAFFSAGRGYAWPWVNPTGVPLVATLPAKARYDAGTPFTQP